MRDLQLLIDRCCNNLKLNNKPVNFYNLIYEFVDTYSDSITNIEGIVNDIYNGYLGHIYCNNHIIEYSTIKNEIEFYIDDLDYKFENVLSFLISYKKGINDYTILDTFLLLYSDDKTNRHPKIKDILADKKVSVQVYGNFVDSWELLEYAKDITKRYNHD